MPYHIAPSGSTGSAPVGSSIAGAAADPFAAGNAVPQGWANAIPLAAVVGLGWLVGKLWSRGASPAEHWLGAMLLVLVVLWVSNGPLLSTITFDLAWVTDAAHNVATKG